MSNIQFAFNESKAIETMLYLIKKLPSPEIYNVCKLLYLADKCSLEKYGRFIFGESYTAMPEGATPSNAYDLIKDAKTTKTHGFKIEKNQIIALREPNLDYLSESDIECIDEIVNKYKDHPIASRNAAHDTAYQQSWKNKGNKGSNPIPVESIANLFADSEDLISYLSK